MFGLSARRPSVRVPLTRQHVQDRLDFARTHVRWTVHDWTPVLFTDESRFCLDFTDKCQLVWRMSKEQFHYLNVAEHDRYGKGSVMVWAGISAKGNTDLYVVENGTLAAMRYCEEILDQLWDHMLVLSVRTLFWWMIMPVPNVHTSLMPRQSCVWTNLLNHWTWIQLSMHGTCFSCFSPTCAAKDFTGAQGCIGCWMKTHSTKLDTDSGYEHTQAMSCCNWCPWTSHVIREVCFNKFRK